jgi:hypothetical protein
LVVQKARTHMCGAHAAAKKHRSLTLAPAA